MPDAPSLWSHQLLSEVLRQLDAVGAAGDDPNFKPESIDDLLQAAVAELRVGADEPDGLAD